LECWRTTCDSAHTHVTSNALARLLAFSVNMAIEFLATPSKQYSLSTAVESRLHELEQKVTFHGEAESSRRNQQDINEDDRKDGHKAIDTRYIETVARTIDGEKATTTREEINIEVVATTEGRSER
jgi:hypothetical protein